MQRIVNEEGVLGNDSRDILHGTEWKKKHINNQDEGLSQDIPDPVSTWMAGGAGSRRYHQLECTNPFYPKHQQNKNGNGDQHRLNCSTMSSKETKTIINK
jgi:hypothetical protein